MILVDSALGAARRRRQSADPGRDDRGGLHGGGDAPADQHRARGARCGWWRSPTARPRRRSQAYADAGQDDAALCDEAAALERAIATGRAAVTEDPMLVATSPQVDVLLEVTGAVEDALPVVLAAIEHGKHVVLMNAELDGTVGPLLKAARRRGRGDLHQRRRRPAGGAAEPLALREGHRRAPGALRQHQGAAGSLPDPDHPGGLRQAVGPAAVDGHLLRRRHQDLASSRRSSPTPPA